MSNPFQWAFAYFKDYLRIQRTISELNSLSDKELNDLGITRWEIPQIAISSVAKYVEYR